MTMKPALVVAVLLLSGCGTVAAYNQEHRDQLAADRERSRAYSKCLERHAEIMRPAIEFYETRVLPNWHSKEIKQWQEMMASGTAMAAQLPCGELSAGVNSSSSASSGLTGNGAVLVPIPRVTLSDPKLNSMINPQPQSYRLSPSR